MKGTETGVKAIAALQIENAFNWVTGGYENSVEDGALEKMPSYEDLLDEIYDTVMTCTTYPGSQSFTPIKEVRFCTTEWIKEQISILLKKDGYIQL